MKKKVITRKTRDIRTAMKDVRNTRETVGKLEKEIRTVRVTAEDKVKALRKKKNATLEPLVREVGDLYGAERAARNSAKLLAVTNFLESMKDEHIRWRYVHNAFSDDFTRFVSRGDGYFSNVSPKHRAAKEDFMESWKRLNKVFVEEMDKLSEDELDSIVREWTFKNLDKIDEPSRDEKYAARHKEV